MKGLILLIALALSGCMAPEQRAKEDDGICAVYRIAGNTQAYAQCRLNLVELHQQQRMAVGAAIADGLDNAANSFNRPIPPAPTPPMRGCAWGYSCPGYF